MSGVHRRHNPQSFDEFAADYDRFCELTQPHGIQWLLASLPSRGERAIDLGCGSGRLAILLAQRFDHVTGIDISEPLIEIARDKRSKLNVEYRVTDLQTFQDSVGFDFVISATALHHVPDLDGALKNIRDLARPQATVILIDNVAPKSPVARWRHVAGALRRAPIDTLRLGPARARWLLKFQLASPWLDHLASDRYQTRGGFENAYGAAFPGAEFVPLRYLHAMVWRDS